MQNDILRTTLLIDADNVNIDVVAQVLAQLDSEARRLQHRRAYGSLQKAQEFEALCNEHAIRFTPTTYVGTNGTDVALTIDAIELALAEPTDEFVLVTSDCDFLPLAARLRELGFLVRGFGQQGKSASIEAYLRVYDAFSLVAGQAPRSRSAAARRPARAAAAADAPDMADPAGPGASNARRAPARTATPGRTARPAHAETVAAAGAAADVAPPSRGRRRAAPAAEAAPGASRSKPATTVADEVARILDAVPMLRDGSKVELGTAATLLRSEQLLAKNAPSTKLFKKYPEQFELTPARQPNKVQYRLP